MTGPAIDNPNLKFALAAAEMAANTRCTNVVLLDLRGKSPVAEYFVIATGSSAIQMRTVAEELKDLGKRLNYAAFRSSGTDDAKWILVDFVHVVFHVFDTDSRDFYDLELLWGDSPKVDWRAALGLPAVVEETREEIIARKAQEKKDAAAASFNGQRGLLDGPDGEEMEDEVSIASRTTPIFPTPEEEEVEQEPKAVKKPRVKGAKMPAAKAVKKSAAKKPAKKTVKTAAKVAKPAKKAAKKAVTKMPAAKSAVKKIAAKKPPAKKPAAKKPATKKKTAKKK